MFVQQLASNDQTNINIDWYKKKRMRQYIHQRYSILRDKETRKQNASNFDTKHIYDKNIRQKRILQKRAKNQS